MISLLRLIPLFVLLLVSQSGIATITTNNFTEHQYGVNYIALDEGIYDYDTNSNSQYCCQVHLDESTENRSFLVFASDFLATKSGRKIDLKEVGSYTNTHVSGKTYSGKGSRSRSQQSGRRQARQNNDPHVATDFTSARNTREAFKQESRRLDANGGVNSSSNYNKVESPGRRYRLQDGDL